MSDSDLANCSASEPFALQVIGNDMAPEFCDGHIVIIDPGGRIHDGCFVIARCGSEHLLRQLRADGDGWRLHALGDGVDDVPLVNGLADIAGVVSQRSGTRRHHHKRYDC